MVLRIHGMDEVGVRFSVGPQSNTLKRTNYTRRTLIA